MSERVFFDGWENLVRVLIVGAMAYWSLILLLRISGKRTLSKMNAFDLVVTVSLGSTLATVLLNKNVALAEGIVAFATLIGLQYLVAWLAVRSRWFCSLVKSEPALLLHRGVFLTEALRNERVTKEEICAAIRSANFSAIENVEAVILETDGAFSVLPRSADTPSTSMNNLSMPASR